MKICITGANGYIGQYLTTMMRDAGHSVTTLTRRPYYVANTQNKVLEHYDLTVLIDLLADQDAVIHLAALAHQIKNKSHELLYQQINVDNTLCLASAAKVAQVKRFIFMSSIKVNGEQTGARPFTSFDMPSPEDGYGRSKWVAEQALKKLLADGSTEIVIVRSPLVWGGVMKGNLALLEKSLKLGIPLPFKNVKNKRDIVSCSNLCELISLLLVHPAAGGKTFLVSDGISRSTAQIVNLIANQLGVKARLISVPQTMVKWASRLPLSKGVIGKLIGNLEIDIEATKEILRWRPKP